MKLFHLLQSLPSYSKHQGVLEGEGGVTLFYTLIKGKSAKPLLTVSAAVHGCEYVGVKTTLELSQEWHFTGHGSILLLHAVNFTGFLARETTLVPEDQVNLNRIFHDIIKPQTFSYQIRELIEEEIFPCTDYLIDLHGGNKEELLTPHGYYSMLSSEEVATISREMLLASGTPIIYSSKATGNMYQRSAIDYSIPSILLEQGENGTCLPEDVRIMKEAVQHVAAYVFEDKVPYHRFTPLTFSDSYELLSKVTGCWTCFVLPNQMVQKGQVVGEICDIYGHIIETVTATQTGLVLYQKATLVVFEDEVLMTVAYHTEQ